MLSIGTFRAFQIPVATTAVLVFYWNQAYKKKKKRNQAYKIKENKSHKCGWFYIEYMSKLTERKGFVVVKRLPHWFACPSQAANLLCKISSHPSGLLSRKRTRLYVSKSIFRQTEIQTKLKDSLKHENTRKNSRTGKPLVLSCFILLGAKPFSPGQVTRTASSLKNSIVLCFEVIYNDWIDRNETLLK